MGSPKKVCFCGLGQVILKHVYFPLKNLEDKGIIEISSAMEVGDLEERIKKLEDRAERYPSEREAAKDILKRLESGNEKINGSRPIKYFQVNGKLPSDFSNYADFVYLATPTNIRAEPIRQFSELGIPINIEKPLGNTEKEINLIGNILNGNKAICSEHYSYKEPMIRFLREFKDLNKRFGKIKFIKGILEENDYLEDERYKWILDPEINGGGIWVDTGVHMMHPIYALGGEVTEITSADSYKYDGFSEEDNRRSLIKSETAADVFFNIEGKNGSIAKDAKGHIRVGKCVPKPKKCFNVLFEKGKVFLDFEENSISYIYKNNSHEVFKKEILEKTKPYSNMILSFLDYLDDGSKKPQTEIGGIIDSTKTVLRAYSVMKDRNPGEYYCRA